MTSLFAGLGFGAPLILWALVLLPVIWWLLRFTPPKPLTTIFPPIRLLLDSRNQQETPAHSPWWLTALRIAIAALVIVALSEPILRPDPGADGPAKPLLIVIDNGWASAGNWEIRLDIARDEINRAREAGMPVTIAGTALVNQPSGILMESPDDALKRLEAMTPRPHAPVRTDILTRIADAVDGQDSLHIVWLADGLGYENDENFATNLLVLSPQSSLTVFVPEPGKNPLILSEPEQIGSGLTVSVERVKAGPAREGRVEARALNGRLLGEQNFALRDGEETVPVGFDMPLELRNEITRIEIVGESSAGAVRLLDDSWRRRRIGLISGENTDAAQPLLSPLFYLEKALSPFAEIRVGDEPTLPETVGKMIRERINAIIMSDVGNLTDDARDEIATWVENGGMLIRFAGPRLAAGSSDLLPVRLRQGTRTLGGTLSWSTPQPLADFSSTSPFADLVVPDDITVSRQVLAEPDIDLPERIWARLQDGTPLVTGTRSGQGWLILFHVTASPDWSTLPLSGVFVDMLRRLIEHSGVSGQVEQLELVDGGGEPATNISLPPVTSLDASGVAGPPPGTAIPIAAIEFSTQRAGPDTPPGFYGRDNDLLALNTIHTDDRISPLGAFPAGARQLTYGRLAPEPIKRWLLLAAASLLLVDALAVIFLSGSMRRFSLKVGRATANMFIVAGILMSAGHLAKAQTTEIGPALSAEEEFALRAVDQTRLAYVLTGNLEIDETARAGLAGLGQILQQRTAMEPGDPIGVNISRDELAFFPLLYWPIDPDARPLDTETAARIDAYMRRGGTILFDTREQTISLDPDRGGRGMAALRRLLNDLDIPAVEPVPVGHVLTKAFYLLQDFPGRFDGGRLWTEASGNTRTDNAGPPQQGNSDGVSTILITSNDMAAAWAIDDNARPVFPVVPGGERQREIAYRVGVNIVMYTLTGNYKADQVHIPALLERLGQ
jgi:uncharacterized protein DUF4159/aerotolerance regulator-like protein